MRTSEGIATPIVATKPPNMPAAYNRQKSELTAIGWGHFAMAIISTNCEADNHHG